MNENQELALDYFRHLVGILYREIGFLKKRHHARLAMKVNLQSEYYDYDKRKTWAKKCYQESKPMTNTSSILHLYEAGWD